MSARVFPEAVPDISTIATALADRSRAAMCAALMDGRAWTVGELAAYAGLARSTASEHVSILVGCGIAVDTRQGRHRYISESMRLRNIPYSIRSPIKSFEYFLVPQLFRCAILADEITAAGLTKGITNPATRTSYYDVKMRVSDYMMCVVLVIGLGGTIIWR